MKCTGSEIIINCLKEQGVDTVFGYPGGAILNVYDELYRHPEITHYLTSHEQGASHAADGYARASGKTGVCLATSGPGATNLITGIATASMDSIPVVAITVNVNRPALGKDSFQEVDIAGVSMPVTKHGFIVKDISVLADTIRRAFKIAGSGRKGPVLIDITKDVTAAEYEYTYTEQKIEEPDASKIPEKDLKAVAAMINKSKKPFIFVGGGCVSASEEVRAFAKRIGACVCDSLMGKGIYSGTDPDYTGMLGMHGTKTSNLTVYDCDLFIALGVRFSDRCVGSPKDFAPQAKILQIDIDEAEINKNVAVDLSLIGDMKAVLGRLMPYVKEHDNTEWKKHVREMMAEFPLKYEKGERLTGPGVVEEIYAQTEGGAVITTDVGQHQMWAAQYYKYTAPRTFITSGGLGTMGYGLGAAIGAKCARPDKTVVNIAGDGCFRMNMNELATASRYDIPVIEIVMDNHVLGMVRQWQTLFYGKRYSQTVLRDKVDYVKVAEALGCTAYRAETAGEFREAFAKALKTGGPVLIDCVIDSDDKVFPMVPPGAPNTDVFEEEDMNKR